MRGTVDCSVFIDGVEVNDGCEPGLDVTVVLDGLVVTWGRATTVDQPSPSTCTFSLLDTPGGTVSFQNLVHTGSAIEVTSVGTVFEDVSDGPINPDSSLENAVVGTLPANWVMRSSAGIVVVTDELAHTGTNSIVAQPQLIGTAFVAVEIMPGPPSTDVSAWDNIRTMRTGEEWTVDGYIRLPPGGRLDLYAQAFVNPTEMVSGWMKLATLMATTPFEFNYLAAVWTVEAKNNGQWAAAVFYFYPVSWENAAKPNYQIDTMTWETAEGLGSWEEWAEAFLDDGTIGGESMEATLREETVFAGRVTDMEAAWDETAKGIRCDVIAADFTSDLAQRDVGAEPWAKESLAARFAHILTASGVAGVDYTIEPSLANYQMTYMDVDRQQAWPLLADLATSVDGVLWSAVHRTTGPYLFLADPRVQSALYVLSVDPDTGLVIVTPTHNLSLAIELDSCDVLLDPVTFRQSVSDVITRVALTWQAQMGVDPDSGQQLVEERTENLIDSVLEAELGTRRAGISTLLTTQADAQRVANQYLSRMELASWRVNGLVWRTDQTDMTTDQTNRVMDLLDGTRRLGAALLLTNLPAWSPAGEILPLLLQGGVYTYEDGQWTLDLATSTAASQGTSLPWEDVDPQWSWDEIDPSVSWYELIGVAKELPVAA